MLTLTSNGEPEALIAALAYAKRGWPVAPAHGIVDGSCTCRDADCGKLSGKHPRTRHGLTDATTDEAKIRSWWTQWPDANVLIRTGKVGDRYLVALDIDPRHGGEENIRAVLLEHGNLPETPMAHTGGGGVHYFMWSKHPVKNSANFIAPGVDVRGVGGYVIAAPSKHISGGEYRWDDALHPSDVALAEAPGWFVALAGTAGERVRLTPSDVQGGQILEMLEGGRNSALIKMAGHMRRPGFGERSILAALRIINEERCSPPLDDWEIEKIARSAATYTPGDPVKSDAATSDVANPFPAIYWDEVIAPLGPVPWLVEGLKLAPGAPTIVGGYSGSGKTFCMQAMLISIASGKPVWGKFPVRQGKVLHLDYEQGERVTRTRYRTIANDMGVKLTRENFELSVLPSTPLKNDRATEDLLVARCDGFAAVLIDAFRGAFPEADENSSTARSYLDMLQRVSERTKCAFIVIAHSGKPVQGRPIKFSLRGSSGLLDAPQTIWIVDGHETIQSKPKRFYLVKDRLAGDDAEVFGVSISKVYLDDPKEAWGSSVAYVSPNETMAAYGDKEQDPYDIRRSTEAHITLIDRIYRFLSAKGACTVRQIRQALSPVSANDLHAALDEMYQGGTLTTEGKGPSTLYSAV